MCGLAGQAALGGWRGPSSVGRMLRLVAHRGPDEYVELPGDEVSLGFVRLSLVDPDGGGQPLSLPDGSLHLIANGEIYNHQELARKLGVPMRTGSDCEVLLHLYRERGERFLDDVRGMFAAVLYDSRNHRLIFARDRFGIKPLFYHRNDHRMVFSSEIKALFADPETPRTLDWERCLSDQAVTSAPAFDVSPAHAWFQDIQLVPAGCVLTVDLSDGAIDTHRYWEFPSWQPDEDETADGLVARYRDALLGSVDDCGMADVEIGLLLSGGIDSAAVGRLARVAPRSFTAMNASIVVNGDAEGASLIARTLGLDHHLVTFPADLVPAPDAWRRHLWLQETPLAGPETYFKSELYRYVAAAAPEVKAMYLGGGADEFNGGYSRILAQGGGWPEFLANVTQMAWRTELADRPALLPWLDYGSVPPIRTTGPGDELAVLEFFHRWKYRDVTLYNCWHEDRSAAGSGIEARVPFLDARLLDVVSAIPAKLAPELLWDKQILRRALIGLLPPEILDRPKTPFFYGDGVGHTYRMLTRMLLRDDAALVEEALAARGVAEVLDVGHVRRLVAEVAAAPRSYLVEFVLRLVNLGLLQAMADAAPPALVDWPAGPPPRRHQLADPAAPAVEFDHAVMPAWALDPARIIAPAENVLLVLPAGDDQTCLVTVDATIEYVVDADADPAWFRFLLALDGARTIEQVSDACGVALAEVRPALDRALDEGILELVDVAG